MAQSAPQSTHVILERYITSPRDMQDVEEVITRHLGGENHRCSFLRSRDYIRLRLKALYSSSATQKKTPTTATVAYHNNLSVSLLSDERGRLVTLRCLDPPVYPSEFEGDVLLRQAGLDQWDRGVRLRTL